MKQNQLNPNNMKSGYFSKLSLLLDQTLKESLSNINYDQKTKYHPISHFLKTNLTHLQSTLTIFKSALCETPFFCFEQITKYNPELRMDIELHLTQMEEDFRCKGEFGLAQEVDKMKKEKTLNVNFFNLEMGMEYLDHLNKYVFIPLTKLNTGNFALEKQARKILIISKKLEYFNKIIFRVHLSSFFNPVLNYEWTKTTDINLKDHIIQMVNQEWLYFCLKQPQRSVLKNRIQSILKKQRKSICMQANSYCAQSHFTILSKKKQSNSRTSNRRRNYKSSSRDTATGT
jgi:hypothetical protein